MAQSSIEWTQLTWNPTTGCSKTTRGCKNCYAEVMSRRLQAMGIEKYKDGFEVRIHPESLNEPYTWKKPKLVFVNSMSDLFHEDIPLDFIKKVFEVMNNLDGKHTFQILTKRADRLLDVHHELTWTNNIWMGVSVEENRVLWRTDCLRQTNARVKFLSCEPLIGTLSELDVSGINWVIVGGESGHRARPVKQKWIIEIQEKCGKAGVPFFFKQWGKKQFNADQEDPTIQKDHPQHAKGGCRIDGEVYRELPMVG